MQKQGRGQEMVLNPPKNGSGDLRGRIEQLEQQVELSQILFDAIPIPVFHLDRENRIILCNQAFETVLQQIREDFIGRSIDEVVSSREFAELIRCPVIEPGNVHGPEIRTARVKFPDGSRHDVEVRHMVAFGFSGEPEGIIGMMIDLTDRKRAEAAEIEAERLRTAQKLAISVAHEFNNPLMIISGVYQLTRTILGNKIGKDVAEHLERIPRAVERMKDLVEKLMNLKTLKEAEYAKGTNFIDLEASSAEPPKPRSRHS